VRLIGARRLNNAISVAVTYSCYTAILLYCYTHYIADGTRQQHFGAINIAKEIIGVVLTSVPVLCGTGKVLRSGALCVDGCLDGRFYCINILQQYDSIFV
jgi:hypothetical protein